ncbi:hypothetical protein [Sphingobacterium suaedae]|uniref:Peptidase M48 domain-containing protein n=1 Tax=Sphingobacterium suaedae TaxID=1686402 RepID=A0ABW5KF86_9SPHI
MADQRTKNTRLDTWTNNKKIPNVIREPILTALSHYPELRQTRIDFVFTQKLRKSIMAARPIAASAIGLRNQRRYQILIRPVFKLAHTIEPIHHVSPQVLIGWIGHELGHIMDYETRNAWGLIQFGILYGLSKKYVRKAERIADTYAVERGMGGYIIATKQFILGHSGLPDKYRRKIARLYLSPDDIVALVASLQNEDIENRDSMLEEEVRSTAETNEKEQQ